MTIDEIKSQISYVETIDSNSSRKYIRGELLLTAVHELRCGGSSLSSSQPEAKHCISENILFCLYEDQRSRFSFLLVEIASVMRQIQSPLLSINGLNLVRELAD